MLFKLKQQISRYRFTLSNRLPNRRARLFLINHLRALRNQRISSAAPRAALGLTTWMLAQTHRNENRISNRFGCFISGRARGTSQRFSVSRVKVQYLSSIGKLFGTRKSS